MPELGLTEKCGEDLDEKYAWNLEKPKKRFASLKVTLSEPPTAAHILIRSSGSGSVASRSTCRRHLPLFLHTTTTSTRAVKVRSGSNNSRRRSPNSAAGALATPSAASSPLTSPSPSLLPPPRKATISSGCARKHLAMSDLNLSSTLVSTEMSDRDKSSPSAATSPLLMPSRVMRSSRIICVLQGDFSGARRCFVPASAIPLMG
mmetsp:Transcript_4947/g.6818  ORF Transcript_4947/g.6818 Transcript_4947/m.6818 type:complete len:204 (-) Transcript_4947:4094-4705(-)